MKQKFSITYARTSYGEIELEAENSHQAEALFRTLAISDRFECKHRSISIPQYRIVDVAAIDEAPTSLRRDARSHGDVLARREAIGVPGFFFRG
ncbi:MAG: hypothetical protein ACLQJR_06340 [Stellaceae bacterium]